MGVSCIAYYMTALATSATPKKFSWLAMGSDTIPQTIFFNAPGGALTHAWS